MARPLPHLLFSHRSTLKKRGCLRREDGGSNSSRSNQESFANNGLLFTTQPTWSALDVLGRLERPTFKDDARIMRMPLLGSLIEENLDKKNVSSTSRKRKSQSPGHAHQQLQQSRHAALSATTTTSASAVVATTSNEADHDVAYSKRKVAHAEKRPREDDLLHTVKRQKPKRIRRQQKHQQHAKDEATASSSSGMSGKSVHLQKCEEHKLPLSSSPTLTNDPSGYRSSMKDEDVSTKHQASTTSSELIVIDDSDDDGCQDAVVSTTIKRSRRCIDDEDEVLFVYPFTKNLREMDSACESLTELGDNDTCRDALKDDDNDYDVPLSNDGKAKTISTNDEEVIFRDSLRITVKDYRLLQPDQYWNDILIDFWMRWISRNQIDNHKNNDVFFFTTQFYTELIGRSPEAMTRWMKRKGVNIFQKKLLFLPIYAELHWTLAVIVNPGHILSMESKKGNGGDKRRISKAPFPCILFFDSLKKASRGTQHDPKTVARIIRDLLNFEWSRLGRAAESKCDGPFTERSMILVTPKVPQQQNGFDCGGFVCREAYGVYRLRHKVFSCGEATYECNGSTNKKKLFKSFFAERPGFVRNKKVGDQNATEAAQRIRKEMMKLIENLSTLYDQRKHEPEIKHKHLIVENHDAGAAKVVKNEEFVPNGIVRSANSLNKGPPTHVTAGQAESFHHSGSKEQHAPREVTLGKQQQRKKKNAYLRDNASKKQKLSIKCGKLRRTRGHVHHNAHPKKKI